MATDQDITNAGPGVFTELLIAMGGRGDILLRSDVARFAAAVTAGLLFLDQQAGQRDQVDHVVLEANLVWSLLQQTQSSDLQVQEYLERLKLCPEPSAEQQAMRDALKGLVTGRPLLVTFVSDDTAVTFPQSIYGQTLPIQAASSEQLSDLGAGYGCTVDTDGRVVGSVPAKV
jgi:hypothetical protein